MSNIGGNQSGDIVARRQNQAEIGKLAEPIYPILDVSEVWDGGTDLRDQLTPEEQARLRPGEIVVHVHRHELELPKTPITPLQVLMKASGAATPEEIGLNGPTVASVNMEDDGKKSRYQRQHGRDDLHAALDVRHIYPNLLDTTVVSLAGSQGMCDEPFDPDQPYGFEKPGSIILVNFEPDDPLGQKFERRKGWKRRFYASCDAPGLFVDGVAELQAMDPSYLIRRTYEAIDRKTYDINHAFDLSVQWLADRIDGNAQGLVEYSNPYTDGRGMRHQGWKDSFDSMMHKNGTYVDSQYGVAPIEIQCQAIISLRKAAAIYRDIYHDKTKADGLNARADNLFSFILENGYIHDDKGDYFAMGWERNAAGGVRPIETRCIDMHYVLRLLDMNNPAHKEMAFNAVVTLTGEDMLTRWGTRVVSASAAGYGDYRYHCGIWSDKCNREVESFSSIGLHGLDRCVGRQTTELFNTVGCTPEYIAGLDAEYPVFPTMDLYVYNPLYNELYLAEQVPPLYQTWDASSEVGKQERYTRIPRQALDSANRKFENKLITNIIQRYR